MILLLFGIFYVIYYAVVAFLYLLLGLGIGIVALAAVTWNAAGRLAHRR